jgi:glutathione S-transferase
VGGVADGEKAHQIEFWNMTAHEGLTDARARASAQKFRAEFDKLDKKLATAPCLMGDALSVLDIAWFIYAHRLSLGGYPLARLHPRVGAWYQRLAARHEFAKEVAMPAHAMEIVTKARRTHEQEGKTMEQVAGF